MTSSRQVKFSKVRALLVVLLTVLVLGFVVIALTQWVGSNKEDSMERVRSGDNSSTEGDLNGDSSGTGQADKPAVIGGGAVLPSDMSGQEAIDALGDSIKVVAAQNGKTVEELEELLLRDSTLHVSTRGFLFYIDKATPPAN